MAKLIPLALLLVIAGTTQAEIRLPNILSDHAVLQRERPIHVWGWATPGSHIVAKFKQQNVNAVADEVGRWSLYLAPEKAGGPYQLTLSGDGADKQANDLLVGDVWVASGQSNMEMPLSGFGAGTPVKDGDKEIAQANNPMLRLLRIDHASADSPKNDAGNTWTQCTPENAKFFSAVAYFFGREISAKERVPVGLIDSSWGGTPADSWVSMNTLGTDPRLLPAFASRATFGDGQIDLQATLAAEKTADDAARAAGQPAPKHPWHPDQRAWLPAALYNGMIAPLTPLTVRGFLWYQGEANSAHDRAPYYDTLMEGLIADWRMHFAQGNLPFLYVQISSFHSPGEDWATVREQQRRVLAVANTAMAVSSDVGNPTNVHPADKQTVASRLALGAKALAYGENVRYRGPEFHEATPELHADGSAAMRVWFDHAEGLNAKGSTNLTSFEVAGADHKFVPASASIEGQTVVVSAAAGMHPAYVRYGWTDVVTESLYNDAGLPLSTFTSEPALRR